MTPEFYLLTIDEERHHTLDAPTPAAMPPPTGGGGPITVRVAGIGLPVVSD